MAYPGPRVVLDANALLDVIMIKTDKEVIDICKDIQRDMR